ncbi:esterase-like activity of phytase family protein [Anthocerotibacter panamensis]|uniref:esterase-like activity of phytase family protein n=1 Tax=Anthocerotibacter panamensis TaxID=2857077 RepID=UPI001C401486|nr:esterase-like activity of phytase family protein [Anthocerotibacter panamensis]
MRQCLSASILCSSVLLSLGTHPVLATELVGRAVLPADTFSPGPTAGQLITGDTNGRPVPFVNQQSVQGFSAVLPGPQNNEFQVLTDNGFGSKANSPDSLLRLWGVRANFTKFGNRRSGTVNPVDLQTGRRLDGFTAPSFIQLSDPNRQVNFPIVAEQTFYPGTTIPVDPSIQAGRLLTGADFDLESFRQVADGTFWFGEEFGPFLLHVAATGEVLEPPIPLPNFLGLGSLPLVQSPDNPFLGTNTANLPRSRGFEGMALNASGTKLFTLLEGPLLPDPNRNRLLIHEFDLATKTFTGRVFSYRMENTTESGQSIGDMTAINDEEFLIIERDSRQGDPNNPAFTNPAQFKRVYKININKLDADGFVEKVLLVDLLNISDPRGIGGNGTTNGVFTFPFVTIESVLPLNPRTLLIINDNNYPFSVGRTPGTPDDNEFIQVRLDQPLNLSR